MIDIHAHILPGLDDGAPDMEQALAMAEMAVESGVTAIVATPHSNLPGYFENYWDWELEGWYRALREAIQASGIPLELYAGMEIFGTEDVPELLREGRLIPLAGTRYPLIEFPFHGYAREATGILADVLELGYRPIVAHPERYGCVQAEPGLINQWTDMGCLLQVNKGSLLGRFGRSAESMAFSLVDRGFAAAVASDAHSPIARTTWMGDVDTLLREEFGADTARFLLRENPRRVLLDQTIDMREPEWF